MRRARRPARFAVTPTVLALALGAAYAPGAYAQAAQAGSAPSAQDVAQMPAVTVQAAPVDDTLEHLAAPVNTGALGNRSQLETPFSTTVVTAADIQERQVNKLGDVFALDASATDNSARSEEHTSELQSLMRISYAVFCLKKKNQQITKEQ